MNVELFSIFVKVNSEKGLCFIGDIALKVSYIRQVYVCNDRCCCKYVHIHLYSYYASHLHTQLHTNNHVHAAHLSTMARIVLEC